MIGLGFILAASIGSGARWWLTSSVAYAWIATLTVNLLGSFGLGLIAGEGDSTSLLLGVAGLGSFTTFSTLMAEIYQLNETAPRAAWALGIASTVFGIGSAWIGLSLA